jgi:TolB-like protein
LSHDETGPDPESPSEIAGGVVGRFRIEGKIGQGGMAVVYVGRDEALRRPVAIKLLPPEHALDEGRRQRFLREARAAAGLSHAHIAAVYEVGEHAGKPYIAMELIEGETLRARLHRGPVEVGTCLVWARQVAGALARAHRAGVVHRDLKPDNVMITRDGDIKVLDFGIAKVLAQDEDRAPAGSEQIATAMTSAGTILGTPGYMSPEQVRGTAVAAASDVFSFGVMFYEMLAGRRAFQGETVMDVLFATVHDAPEPLARLRTDVPEELIAVVNRCLEKQAEDRFANGGDLAAALTGLSEAGRPGRAAPAGAVPVAPWGIELTGRSPALDTARARAIAVIPFRSSGAAEDADLATMLAEDIIDALSVVKGLRVLARGAVVRFGGSERDVREVGQELGVGLVIGGSLRRVNEARSVAVRLIDVETGYQVWTMRFDITPEQIVRVADDAARAIATALSLDASGLGREAPLDPAALELYLRARRHYHRFTPPDLTQSIALFEAALERAPDNPLVAAGLSLALARGLFAGAPAPDAITKAVRCAESAIQRAPHLGEPHLATGYMRLHSGDPVGAARSAHAAIARVPSLAEAHELLGRLLIEAARVAEGVQRCEAALGLDPNLNIAPWELARVAALDGDWARYDRIVRETPNSDHRGRWGTHLRYAVWRGDRRLLLEAEEAIGRDAEIPPGLRSVLQAAVGVYVHRRSPAPLLQMVEGAASLPATTPRGRQWLCQYGVEAAAFAGLNEEALRVLEKADQAGLFDLLWLDRCPLLAALRAAPDFAGIRRSIQARADAVAAAVAG